MKNIAIRQANTLINWLESHNKSINDIDININLKNDNHEVLLTIMSDGSISMSDDSVVDPMSFSSATDCIKQLSKTVKDSLPNQAKFVLTLKTRDLLNKHQIELNADELQKLFDTFIVKSFDDDKIKLLYIGNIFEEPNTVAIDFVNKYGFNPIDIKKL